MTPKGCCKFIPSCSDFAQEAIEKLPLWKAIMKITGRILRCNPFSKGGYDPVLRTSRKV
jgi:putative membrane protein insertion efficiency factor